jgi:hypothetical protein
MLVCNETIIILVQLEAFWNDAATSACQLGPVQQSAVKHLQTWPVRNGPAMPHAGCRTHQYVAVDPTEAAAVPGSTQSSNGTCSQHAAAAWAEANARAEPGECDLLLHGLRISWPVLQPICASWRKLHTNFAWAESSQTVTSITGPSRSNSWEI